MRIRSLTVLMGISTIGLLAASPALATDLMSPIEDVPMMSSGAMPTGYIEVNAGVDIGQSEHFSDYYSYDDTDEWNEVDIGVSGRVAIPVADPVTLQLDAWALAWRGSDTYCYDYGNTCDDPSDYDGVSGGLAAHLAYNMDGGLIGGMVSVGGGNDDGPYGWATAALEAARDMDNFRLYGQIGVSKAISGDDADNNEMDIFAQGVLAYYIDPNLVVSVNVGADSWSGDYGDETGSQVTWGLRLEKKIDGTPASVYVAYQGWAWGGSGMDPGLYQWDESANAILVGLRFAFGDDGSGTLKDLNSAVGLVDMNPVYGDLPH